MTGVFVPAETPKPIVELLQTEISTIVGMPEVKSRLQELGIVPEGDSSADFASYVKNEIAKWKRVIEVGKIDRILNYAVDHGGCGGWQGRGPQCVDAGARRRNQGGRERPAGLAHLRQPAIKKALCRGADRDRAWLSKGAAVVRARLSLPCADCLSNGQSQLHVGAADRDGRRLQRQGTRSVVHRCRPASEAVAHCAKEKPPLRMADLPAACGQVLSAPRGLAARKSALDHAEHRS